MFGVFVLVLVIGQCLGLESHPWVPQPGDKTWFEKHERLVNQTIEHGKDAKIVFIGDSITELWGSNGKEVWDKYYSARHGYNYGIGGEGTQHVLYRIENKELDGMKPKVAVLMIGTNNLNPNTVEDITHGVQEILRQLKVKLPSTKVLLLGILPRPQPLGAKAQEVNALIAKMADGKTVFFLDMRTAFIHSDGTLRNEIYTSDGVHLLAAGYQVWQKTMEPLLMKLAETYPWVAQDRNNDWWYKRHQQNVNMSVQHGKEARLIFLGDSITEGWLKNGKDVWKKHFGNKHAYNYGIGGDATQHVLYRIQNKEVDAMNPKVAVLMIGTNNIGSNTVEDIAHGVQEILKELSVKLPQTKVILLGVLPRPEPHVTEVKQLNQLLKKLADEKRVYFLDMWLAFESADGKQKMELYEPNDKWHVHLVAAGYEVWAKTMEPLLNKLDPALL